MKRLHAVGLFVLGFVAAGAFSGAVIADVTTSTTVSTATTTTDVTTTTSTVTTTPSLRATIPSGVRVAGVRVAGLAPADAVAAVRAAFRRPLPVAVDRTLVELDPAKIASAYVATAVARARIAAPGTDVRLVVAVNGAPLRAWLATVRKRVDRAPVDARVQLRDGRPYLSAARPGRALSTALLAEKVVAALKANTRLTVRMRAAPVAPGIAVSTTAETIVISRSINRLYLYDQAKLVRMFPVATGQSVYPTPLGVWHIVIKEKNPWWYPPVQDSWAKGLKPVPPGPSNPLGTRWMGLNSPGIGIHGTDEPGSIGYSASHGCIRMHVPDAEWLYDHVGVGTTVYIL